MTFKYDPPLGSAVTLMTGDLIDINENNPPPGEFDITCKKCGGPGKVSVDYANYDSCGWCNVEIRCSTEGCGNVKVIYDSI